MKFLSDILMIPKLKFLFWRFNFVIHKVTLYLRLLTRPVFSAAAAAVVAVSDWTAAVVVVGYLWASLSSIGKMD